MKAQVPAEGIMKTRDLGDYQSYLVECSCGSTDCRHDIVVEADDDTPIVNVTLYVTVKTASNRWKYIWELLTKGFVRFESTTLLSEPVALNYSYALKKASEDVRRFREKNIIKS